MRHSLHVAPLTDVSTPLHAPSNWSAVFHSVTPLTDMRVPVHALSDWSAVFHSVAPLTDMCAPLHDPSDPSAVFHFVTPLTDMRVPLHAPSDWSAVFHFISPLTDMRTPLHAPSDHQTIRSVCRISLRRSSDWLLRHSRFLAADLRLFSLSQDVDAAFAAAIIAPALVITMLQTESSLLQRSGAGEDRMVK